MVKQDKIIDVDNVHELDYNDSVKLRFDVLKHFFFIKKFEERIIRNNLPIKMIYVEYNGFRGKFISLEALNSELTDVRIGNILCSSAMFYNRLVMQCCDCHRDELFEQNKTFNLVFETLDDNIFIDFIKQNKINEENPGFRFINKNKEAITSSTLLVMRFE